jgi:serine phosphatase RsbU (regulator of sigma subunit)
MSVAFMAAVRSAAASVRFDAATGASGDWHDVIGLPNGNVAVVVGDAVGHGAPAEPLKLSLQTTVRRLALAGRSPLQIVAHVRAQLESRDDAFATLLYAVIAPHGGHLSYTNAGHPPPLIVGRRGGVSFLAGGSCPLLGAPCADSAPAEGHSRVRPGDTLVLYTDGLIEAAHRDADIGLQRLAARASWSARAPLREMCNRLVCLGLDGARPTDDLTAVAVRLQRRQALYCATASSSRGDSHAPAL